MMPASRQAASSAVSRAARARARRNAEARERPRRLGRFAGGVRSEAVIDDEGEHRAARRPCPIGGEDGQGHAVATARNADGQPW
jgi:hypothetical protein